MNPPDLRPLRLFVYIGPGDGKDVVHRIVHVEKGEVVTWSDPVLDGLGLAL